MDRVLPVKPFIHPGPGSKVHTTERAAAIHSVNTDHVLFRAVYAGMICCPVDRDDVTEQTYVQDQCELSWFVALSALQCVAGAK